MVAGSVKKINNGFTVIRNNPKTIATYIADSGFASSTPGKKRAKTNTANAVNIILNIIFIYLYFQLLTTIIMPKTYLSINLTVSS